MSAEEIKDTVNLEPAPASGIPATVDSFDLLENKMKDPISKKPQSSGQ